MSYPYHPFDCDCDGCRFSRSPFTYRPLNRNRKISFSWREVWALTRGLLGIAIALTILIEVRPTLINNGFSLSGIQSLDWAEVGMWFAIMTGIAGSGFILHELAHKFVAQRYGFHAEFKAFDVFIAIGIVMAFFLPLIFLAPGAVVVAGLGADRRQTGFIGGAGPLVNIVLGLGFAIFYAITLTTDLGTPWPRIGFIGLFINSWLALFNLLPFSVLDGAKVFNWNRPVWTAMMAIAVTGFIVALTVRPS